MPTLYETYQKRLAEANNRGTELPVLGPVQPQGKPTVPEDEGFFKGLLRGTLGALTFSAEKLAVPGEVMRGSIAAFYGRLPRDKSYMQNLHEAFTGKVRLTGREFLETMLSQDILRKADALHVPGWTKQILDPNSARFGQMVPRFTLGGALGLNAEMFVDPLLLLGAAPKSVLTALHVGKATQVALWPVRWMGKGMFNADRPLGAWLLKGLDPDVALRRTPELVNDLKFDFQLLGARGNELKASLSGLAKRHSAGMTPKAFEHLYLGDRALSGAEKAFVDDVLENFLKPARDRLAQQGDHIAKFTETIKVVGETQPGFRVVGGRLRPSGAGPATRRVKRTFRWNPERDLLRAFVPLPKNYLRAAQQIGTTSLKQRANINLPWRGVTKTPYDASRLAGHQKDPLHSISSFLANVEERLILHRPEGALAKWTLWREGWREVRQNPRLRDMNPAEFQYWRDKVHQITGHSAGRTEIAERAVSDHFWHGIDSHIGGTVRRSRILSWLDKRSSGKLLTGMPRASQAQRITQVMLANQITALLGGNLSAAFKNTSQLLNTAAVKGITPLIKGMYLMTDPGTTGQALRQARKLAGFGHELDQLVLDQPFVSMGGWRALLMKPFNAMEQYVRGVSFNISAGEALTALPGDAVGQLAKASIDDVLKTPQLARVVRAGILDALETNFTYGIAGRSEWMARPVQRLAFSLQSFSWKFAAFAAKQLEQNPEAFVKLAALHGWTIEQLYLQAGVNAENWLGWGFTPPNPLGRGPTFDMLINMMGLTTAAARGDGREVERRIDRMRGNMRELSRFYNAENTDRLEALVSALATAGALPIPVVAMGKTAKVVNEIKTGKREGPDGEFDKTITPREAVVSYLWRTHRDVQDAHLKRLTQFDRKVVDSTIDKRVKVLVKALDTSDGQAVRDATQELFKPIPVRQPIQIGSGQSLFNPGLTLSLLFGEETQFRPHPDGIFRRIENAIVARKQPSAVREMLNAGWVFDLLAGEYMRTYAAEIEAQEARR